MRVGAAYVMAAPDPVACWGAAELMRREFGLPITAITGPATDNEVGQVYITGGPRPAGAQRAAGRGGAAGGRAAGDRRVDGEGGADGADRRAWRRCAGPPAVVSAVSAPMKVAVVGAAGYAGGELLRLLLQHPGGHRVRGHQPEPGRQADRRRPSGAGAGCRTRASPAPRPARRRAGGTSSSSASSTASRPGWRARCSMRARAWSSTSRPTSGCAIPRLYERFYGPHAAPELVQPLHLRPGRRRRAAGSAAPRPSPRPAASRRRRSSRSIRWRGPDST